MPLKKIGILHIADLHYGLPPTASGLGKAKISEKLKRDIGSDDPKEIFLGRISALSQVHKVDTLVFTGDLGYHDDLEAMEDGIDYLSTLGERLRIAPENVVVSPGNHDLNRKDAVEKEFASLVEKSRKKGFTVAVNRENPACIQINGVPVVALNTCLGGTEHAYYHLPEDFWNKVRDIVKDFDAQDEHTFLDMPEAIRSQLKAAAMDIPAIGQHQCNEAESYLNSMTGNFAVVIGHHNPLPTHMLVVRPYAEIIDAGRLIFDLLGNERRILFLHGHTHCDTALLTRSPDIDNSGLMICIGATGLHKMPGATSSVSFIQVLTDDKPDFLCAIVYRYQLRGSNLVQSHPFIVWDDVIKPNRSKLSIAKLKPGKTFTVEEIAGKLNQSSIDTEELAVELLKHRVTYQIDIMDVNRPTAEWSIIVNK